MSRALHGRHFARDILDALGIDSTGARAVRIEASVDTAATIHVEYIQRWDEITTVLDEAKNYRAIPENEWRTFYLIEEAREAALSAAP